jgi:hypothetical protein
MKKFIVQYARIEHFIYLLDIEAETEEQARELARLEFTGDEDYKIVHAEEFVLNVMEVEGAQA